MAGLFLAVALFDLLPLLPGWLHAALLIGFAAAFVAAAWHGARGLRWPSADAACRRLERDSGVAHRPLAALDDEIASGGNDEASVGLWLEHRRRLVSSLSGLRAGPPQPVMAKADPLALRSVLVLLLILGAAIGIEDWTGRLSAALKPQLQAQAESQPPSLDAWINPPAYTGLPPRFLGPQTEAGPAIEVPVGSMLLAQVQGGTAIPQVEIGAAPAPFEEVAASTYKFSQKVTSGDRLTIRQGRATLAQWPISILPDDAPAIEFMSAPGRTERAILRLHYQAQDDYGLTQVTARIARVDDPEIEPLELALPLSGKNVRVADNMSYHDLTPHPWAGIAVEITLVARDALDQTGESDPVRTVLPERIFNHPVARALVELRKQLTLDPTARLPVVRALADLYKRPDHFFDDLVVALAIKLAERRLIHDRKPEAVPKVQQLLWDTALRIEEGELAIAERDLRDIQKKLQEALAEGASDEEIRRLMDELEAALDRFLEALAQQLQEQMARGDEPQEMPPDAQALESSELQRMLDQARQLAESGARDAARELLSRLQDILENLRANPLAQMMSPEGQNAWDMMRDMERMMQQQQELLDRSYRRNQEAGRRGERGQQSREGEPRQGQRGEGGNQEDARTQEQLRRELGEMMRRLGDALGDIPRPLGRAERAMRDARDALGRNQPGEAIDPQSRALDQLQQGMESAAEAFMQQLGTAQGQGQGTVGMQPGPGRDPLGRQSGDSGLEALEGVRIPEQMELRRAREILDELRRRRGQRHRPPLELDYIDRLLQQF